jgi:hypothetical protein
VSAVQLLIDCSHTLVCHLVAVAEAVAEAELSEHGAAAQCLQPLVRDLVAVADVEERECRQAAHSMPSSVNLMQQRSRDLSAVQLLNARSAASVRQLVAPAEVQRGQRRQVAHCSQRLVRQVDALVEVQGRERSAAALLAAPRPSTGGSS